MKKYVLLLLLLPAYFTSLAITDEQLWFAYIHLGRVHKHWGYWVDIQHRTKNQFANSFHQDLFRVGATWYATNDVRITIGHAEILTFPSLTNQAFIRPEHRPWQQVFYTYTDKTKRARFSTYLRAEQRFMRKVSGEKLIEGYNFRQRFRYNAMLVVGLNNKEFKQGSWGIVLNDEVFINAYSQDKVKAFDQNRAFVGFSYNITTPLQLHLGYLNVYSLTPKGHDVVHAIRLAAFHTIDWRKSK